MAHAPPHTDPANVVMMDEEAANAAAVLVETLDAGFSSLAGALFSEATAILYPSGHSHPTSSCMVEC